MSIPSGSDHREPPDQVVAPVPVQVNHDAQTDPDQTPEKDLQSQIVKGVHPIH